MLTLLFLQYKLHTCVDCCNFKKQRNLQHEVNESTSSQERSRTDDRSPNVNSPADQDVDLAVYSGSIEYEDVEQNLQHEVNEGTPSQERSHTDGRHSYVNYPADQEFNLADHSVPVQYENVDQLGSSRPAVDYQHLNPMTIGVPDVYTTLSNV